jgi:hypothetical protein
VHQLHIEHQDRETYRGECTCGEWESALTIDDIPHAVTGVFEQIATEILTRRHQAHVASANIDR